MLLPLKNSLHILLHFFAFESSFRWCLFVFIGVIWDDCCGCFALLSIKRFCVVRLPLHNMLSSVARALGSLQGLQRRYILITLVGCAVIWTLSFHDVSDVVATSKATYESYRDEYFTANEDSTEDSVVGGGVMIDNEDDGRVQYDLQSEGGSEVNIEVDEEELPADAGVLPPDLVPVDEYASHTCIRMTAWFVGVKLISC